MSKKTGVLDELTGWLKNSDKGEQYDDLQTPSDSLIEELRERLAMEQDPKARVEIQKQLDELMLLENEEAELPTNVTGIF
jgi:hypothetical protein